VSLGLSLPPVPVFRAVRCIRTSFYEILRRTLTLPICRFVSNDEKLGCLDMPPHIDYCCRRFKGSDALSCRVGDWLYGNFFTRDVSLISIAQPPK
jgi:hypothetical protein